MKKTPTSISFDSICELSEKPSLVGKLVVNLLGVLGAGNGRCMVSPTLPRFGTPVEGGFEVQGYTVCLNDLGLGVDVLLATASATTVTLSGPRMAVSQITREQLQTAKNLPDPVPQILALYPNLIPEEVAAQGGSEGVANAIRQILKTLLQYGGEVKIARGAFRLMPDILPA